MAKKRIYKKTNVHQDLHADDIASVVSYTPVRAALKPIEPLNEAQAHYLAAIRSGKLIFGIGPAGTGKTFCAASWAAEQLLAKKIEQIILTRPAVETGASMGFLPGTLEEKYEPFLQPFRETLVKRMGKGPFEYALKSGKISPRPLAFMRGATFDNAVVLLDEAQNITPAEMLMFLTRIGDNCTVIVSGDIAQCDLKGPSGLEDAVGRLHKVPGVKVFEFEEEDIVRSGLVRDVIKAYRH
jgi:phosphate starvation-inducible PhoH-like protein